MPKPVNVSFCISFHSEPRISSNDSQNCNILQLLLAPGAVGDLRSLTVTLTPCWN